MLSEIKQSKMLRTLLLNSTGSARHEIPHPTVGPRELLEACSPNPMPLPEQPPLKDPNPKLPAGRVVVDVGGRIARDPGAPLGAKRGLGCDIRVTVAGLRVQGFRV